MLVYIVADSPDVPCSLGKVELYSLKADRAPRPRVGADRRVSDRRDDPRVRPVGRAISPNVPCRISTTFLSARTCRSTGLVLPCFRSSCIPQRRTSLCCSPRAPGRSHSLSGRAAKRGSEEPTSWPQRLAPARNGRGKPCSNARTSRFPGREISHGRFVPLESGRVKILAVLLPAGRGFAKAPIDVVTRHDIQHEGQRHEQRQAPREPMAAWQACPQPVHHAAQPPPELDNWLTRMGFDRPVK